MFCLWRDLASLTEMSKWHQTWDKKEEINYKKPSIHPIRIMYACKFSDLFRSQLCRWLIQSTVLCRFTLIFLLHSLKCSLSIHHIFHQLVCSWSLAIKGFYWFLHNLFCLFHWIHSIILSVCPSVWLLIFDLLLAAAVCISLQGAKSTCGEEGRPGDLSKAGCPKAVCKKTLQNTHRKDTGRKKMLHLWSS